MRYILIPVKDLSRAKQRLATIMTQEERTLLARTMLETTLASVARVRNAERVAIVTLYKPAIELAEKYGMEVILETEQISESASVDFGSRIVMRCGAKSVLRLPIDLPLITTEDIEKIFDRESQGPSVVLVPSRDGTGTNAILRRPPDLIPSHFGAGSLAKHVSEAERAKAECHIMKLSSVALDIDDPEDIAILMGRGERTRVYEMLLDIGINERLKPLSVAESNGFDCS